MTTFGDALDHMRMGRKVARIGWAAGTYLVYDTTGKIQLKVGSNNLTDWTNGASDDWKALDWWAFT